MLSFITGTVDPITQWKFGYIVTMLISLVFLVNIICLVVISVKTLKLILKRKMNLRAHKKIMKNRNKIKPAVNELDEARYTSV